MKKHFYLGCLLGTLLIVPASAQTLYQTFEPGENTSNWGSTWQAPAGYSGSAAGFLDPSLGGTQAGYASSAVGQEAYRDFRNNTVGINVAAAPYSVSLYLIFDSTSDPPASGSFYVLDGTYGDYTAGLRLQYNGTKNAVSWEAATGNNNWQALNVSLDMAEPYLIQYTIDPTARTYSTTVSQVNDSGMVLSSDTLNNPAITGNAINNGQNGQLFFHVEGSAGTVNFRVDNIQVTSTPEPASTTLILTAAAAWIALKCRRATPPNHCPARTKQS